MLNSILLQVVNTVTTVADSAANVATQVMATPPAAPKQDTLSLLELIMKGGIIMIPMALLSLLTIYFFFERFIVINKASKLDGNFIHNIKDYIHNGKIDAARAMCASSGSPAARIIEKGISRIGKPIKEIEQAMENVAKLEVNKLEKNISILSLVGRIAPILGFVGTIAGVIKIFYDISLTDNISIGAISSGLYQKMITSASGLIIGLFAFIGYYILNSMINKTINKMETASVHFMDILETPGK